MSKKTQDVVISDIEQLTVFTKQLNENQSKQCDRKSRSSSPITTNACSEDDKLLQQQQQQQQQQHNHLLALQYLQHVVRQHQLNLLLLQQQQQLQEQQDQSDHQSSASLAILTQPTTTRTKTSITTTTIKTACEHDTTASIVNPKSDESQITATNTNALEGNHIDSDHVHMNAINAMQLTSAANGFFNRKRGRPPKNRFVEVYENRKQTPQAIFTSFKLEKQRLHAAAAAAAATTTTTTAMATRTSPTPYHFNMLHNNGRNDDDDDDAVDGVGDGPTTRSVQSLHNQKITDRLVQMQKHSSLQALDHGSKRADNAMSLDMVFKRAEQQQQQHPNVYPDSATKCNLKQGRKQRLMQQQKRFVPYVNVEKCGDLLAADVAASPSMNRPNAIGNSTAMEHISVVRAAGTFYPENYVTDVNAKSMSTNLDYDNHSNQQLKFKDRKLSKHLELNRLKQNFVQNNSMRCASNGDDDGVDDDNGDGRADSDDEDSSMPQDLSITRSNDQVDSATVQKQQQLHTDLQQLIELYRRTQQKQQQNATTSSATQSITSEMSIKSKTSGSRRIAEKLLTPKPSANETDVVESMMSPTALITAGPTLNRYRCDGVRHMVGYMKYRYSENCGYLKCAYSTHQSHFHCNRNDCNYSFCDKSRIVQHTARHERLDQLMGEDFQQFRNNSNCAHTNCIYAERNTAEHAATMTSDAATTTTAMQTKKVHYHCRKCAYACCETNKILAHRRHHSKLEHIQSAGFRKVHNGDDCRPSAGDDDGGVGDICPYRVKHTHYHCLVCNGGVLSRAQLQAHKHKHKSFSTKETHQMRQTN